MRWGWLSRLFGWLRPTPPTPDPPANPLTRHPNPNARPLDIAVYQTEGLTDRLDRVPERTVVEFMAQALTDAGYNVRIQHGLDALPLPDTPDTLADFAAEDRAGADLNLLLGDRNGGGRAYHGGKYAIGPAGNIDRRVRLRETAPAETDTPRLWINLRASALHEPGHALGGRHADRMTDPRWDTYPDTPASLLFHNTDVGWMDAPSP